MVKPAHRRAEKYKTGIDPSLTERKLRAVKDVMVDLETPYLAEITEIERKVKRICETAGVTTHQIAQYINYARQLYSKCKKFSSVTLTNAAQNLTDLWLARGLSCPILVDIGELFGVTVSCVAPAEGNLCDLEDVTCAALAASDVLHYDGAVWRNTPQFCRIATGQYTGDGAASQSIVGIGFQPKYLMFYRRQAAAVYIYAKTDQEGVESFVVNWAIGVMENNIIISLDADGFTVGNWRGANDLGVTFSFIAWR